MASSARRPRPPSAPRSARKPAAALKPDLVGAICEAFRPIDPGAEARDALRSRLLRRVHAKRGPAVAPAPPDNVVIRAHDSGWVDLAPGVHAKLLYTDGRAESYLARLDPGVVIPAHAHPGVEECLVLEGRLEFSDGGFLQAGDYQAQFASSRHAEMAAPQGALLFLRYAERLSTYLTL